MTSSSPPPSLALLSGRQIQWIAAGFVLTFASLPGQTIFIAQFNTAIRAQFDLSHGAFGFLYTLATLGSSLCLVYVGALTDRFSIRKLAIATLLGLSGVALLMSQTRHVAILVLALFGLRLFGQGMMSQIAATAMARWFNRFRGRALAISHLGFSFGESTMPIAAAILIGLWHWQQVWIGAAAFIGLAVVPLIIFLLRDPPDGRRAVARGEVNPDATHISEIMGHKWTRGAVLRDPLFYPLVLGLMAPPAITTLFLFHQAHLAEIKGWSALSFAAFFPLFSAASVLFALLSGALIDRVGAWRLLIIMLVPEGIACLLMASLETVWTIPAFFILLGTTHGIMSPVGSAIWAEIYGTAHIGAIRALATSALVFASAIGPGIAGALIDAGFELNRQSYIYAALCFAGATGFALMSRSLGQRKALLI